MDRMIRRVQRQILLPVDGVEEGLEAVSTCLAPERKAFWGMRAHRNATLVARQQIAATVDVFADCGFSEWTVAKC